MGILGLLGLDEITGFGLGALMILLASALETFWSFGRQARPNVKPAILRGWGKWVALALWIILLLGGGVFLLDFQPIVAAIGVFSFWLVLPFILTPIFRNRLLPKWEQVKKELAPKGLNEKDYWRGDWWMEERRKKQQKEKAEKPVTSTAASRKKDYYEVLGIRHSATFEEIAAAYRKLAMDNNPDLNPGKEQEARAKMKELDEAFNVLSNPKKRQKYSG